MHVQANNCSLSFIVQTPQTFVRLYTVDRLAVMQKGLVVLHHLLLSLSPRSSEVVRVVGARWDQLPAATCSWKGGRYTVRE